MTKPSDACVLMEMLLIVALADTENQAYVAEVRDAIKTTTITTVEIIKPFFFIVFLLVGIKPLSKKLYPYIYFFIFFVFVVRLGGMFPSREIATLALAMTRGGLCAVLALSLMSF